MKTEQSTHGIAAKNLLLVAVNIMLGLFVFGCEKHKLAECEQIFQVAQHVIAHEEELNRPNKTELTGETSWLQTAEMMDRAADRLEALNIDNSKLIQYRDRLATIYRLYSQATYDAVSAREQKNLAVLKSARNNAEQAGLRQQKLVREINTFCLERN